MGGNYGGLLYIVILFVIMYFIMIRPQQKRNKERQNMLDNLKKNDRIVTVGGLHGRITSLREDTVNIEIARNVVVTIEKSGISYVESEAPDKNAKEEEEAAPEAEEDAAEVQAEE